MPHNIDLVLTLTAGFAAALMFGLVTQRLKLSPIAGYLLAGIAIGPHTPGFAADVRLAEQLAELGVILLMFGVGLHFHVRDLLAVRKVAVPGALAQIAVATALGAAVAAWFGWPLGAGFVFGGAISVASTVVLLRVLSDNDALHTPAGHVAVGWLIVEDLFTVFALVMLPTVARALHERDVAGVASAFGVATLQLAALVALSVVLGRRAIPALLARVARTRSRELFTLAVLVVALGVAVGSAVLFGASLTLGAFLAGMVVGQSEFASRAASEALPLRDAFAVLFFVSTGMLFDPTQLRENAGLIAATLAVVLVAKPIAALGVVLAMRRPIRTAVSVAIALAQIGEFSFILAALGQQLGLLPTNAMQALVAAAVVSITLNPVLFRLVDPITRAMTGVRRRRSVEERVEAGPSATVSEASRPSEPEHRAIVVGHGPVGRTLVRLLQEAEIEPTVIELNHETVAELHAHGVRAVYGDASQHEILLRAGILEAGTLVFAASGAPGDVIRRARELNRHVSIVTRATYVAEAPALRKAGADVIVPAEGEVALAMVERVLTRVGATNEQLDRERDRVRSELSGS
jgi:CPA2 family monovalent cation:H+ antiporter-2